MYISVRRTFVAREHDLGTVVCLFVCLFVCLGRWHEWLDSAKWILFDGLYEGCGSAECCLTCTSMIHVGCKAILWLLILCTELVLKQFHALLYMFFYVAFSARTYELLRSGVGLLRKWNYGLSLRGNHATTCYDSFMKRLRFVLRLL